MAGRKRSSRDTKSHTERNVLILGLSFVALLVIMSYFAFRTDERRRRRMTAEFPAEVTEVYVSYKINPEDGKPNGINNVRVTYRYVLKEQAYTRTKTFSGRTGKDFKVGAPAKVCYNPENVDEAELFQLDHKCGSL